MRPEISATSPSGNVAVPELVESLLNRAERVIVGQRENMEMVLLALICGGHILLEGVPGTAKTLTARTVARLLQMDCKRIQFTPDLMPSDIIGTNVFNLQTSRFEFRPGPVFTDILVATGAHWRADGVGRWHTSAIPAADDARNATTAATS